ncbi:MAG: hypothetical protein GVY08_03480 [Bacteroidetes bacterium]|nr:hypothetical protein [Bacteroidota bacterium]
METVTITPNLRLARGIKAVTGLAALLGIGIILHEFFIGKTPDLWFLYLPVFAWLTFNNLGIAFGYYDYDYSTISLDKSKLSVSGYMGGDVDLDKISWMRLKNSRIEFEFSATGYKSYFRIPWNFRIKSRLGPLKKALQERCRHQGIEFESEF